MRKIDEFVADLAREEHSPTVSNPYRNPDLAANLRLYLNTVTRKRGRRVLLVGEAPGYRGCLLTGIPFSCGTVFERFDHPLLRRLRGQLRIERVESENTATIVWEYLARTQMTPLFWNAFPLHPHLAGRPDSNRAPNAGEMEIGLGYLRTLGAIYRPEVIGGIGNKGFQSAARAFPQAPVARIRHPSRGGKAQFVLGMDDILA